MWRNGWHMALLLALSFTFLAYSENTMPREQETGGECSSCHSSETPSMDDLIPGSKCRRPRTHDKLDEGASPTPEVIIMDQLSEIYVPVVFPHGLHAQMEGISTGCSACHHHGEEGKIVNCRTCHSEATSAANLRQPGLKGAYHRQCLACHREWSHDTDCIFCHAKRVMGADAVQNLDPSDITGSLHPNVIAPLKQVYPTPEQEAGSMVTFHHRDHVDLFGKRCVDCHQNENCSRCHDAAGRNKHVREDSHEDCIKCHDTSEDCAKCHKDHEAEPFDHGKSTPFMLKPYHAEVTCIECHEGGKFKLGKKVCKDCHAPDWFPEEFDHGKTGLTFKESHKDNECLGCHPAGLGEPTDCSVCHDDKKYPQDSPFISGPQNEDAAKGEQTAEGEAAPAAEEKAVPVAHPDDQTPANISEPAPSTEVKKPS